MDYNIVTPNHTDLRLFFLPLIGALFLSICLSLSSEFEHNPHSTTMTTPSLFSIDQALGNLLF